MKTAQVSRTRRAPTKKARTRLADQHETIIRDYEPTRCGQGGTPEAPLTEIRTYTTYSAYEDPLD